MTIDPASKSGGPRTRGSVPPILTKGIRLFRDGQVAAVVDYIITQNMQVTAPNAASAETKPNVLVASSPVESISIQIDERSFLPTSFRRELRGVGSPEQVNWYDFRELGKTKYPYHMLIQFSPTSKEGVEFRFTSVELASDLALRDFR